MSKIFKFKACSNLANRLIFSRKTIPNSVLINRSLVTNTKSSNKGYAEVESIKQNTSLIGDFPNRVSWGNAKILIMLIASTALGMYIAHMGTELLEITNIFIYEDEDDNDDDSI